MEPEYCTTIFCNEKDCQWMVTINTKSSSESKQRAKNCKLLEFICIDETKNKY